MKEMTPKERVMAFFRHEPVDELPTDEGIFVLFNPEAYKERPSHEHGGVDWFGVPLKYESSVDAIAPDHSVEPIMEDICAAIVFLSILLMRLAIAASRLAIASFSAIVTFKSRVRRFTNQLSRTSLRSNKPIPNMPSAISRLKR